MKSRYLAILCMFFLFTNMMFLSALDLTKAKVSYNNFEIEALNVTKCNNYYCYVYFDVTPLDKPTKVKMSFITDQYDLDKIESIERYQEETVGYSIGDCLVYDDVIATNETAENVSSCIEFEQTPINKWIWKDIPSSKYDLKTKTNNDFVTVNTENNQFRVKIKNILGTLWKYDIGLFSELGDDVLLDPYVESGFYYDSNGSFNTDINETLSFASIDNEKLSNIVKFEPYKQDDLYAYWILNDTNDLSSNNYDLTKNGGMTYLDSSDCYDTSIGCVNTTSSTNTGLYRQNMALLPQDMTWQFVTTTKYGSGTYARFFNYRDGSPLYDFEMWYADSVNNFNLRYGRASGNTNAWHDSANNGFDVNSLFWSNIQSTWSVIHIVYNHTSHRYSFYLNGDLKNTEIGDAMLSMTNDMFLFAEYAHVNPPAQAGGGVVGQSGQHWARWDKALSEDEVAEAYDYLATKNDPKNALFISNNFELNETFYQVQPILSYAGENVTMKINDQNVENGTWSCIHGDSLNYTLSISSSNSVNISNVFINLSTVPCSPEMTAQEYMVEGINEVLDDPKIYYDQKIYQRSPISSDDDVLAEIDLVVFYGNQRWLFNYVYGQTKANLFNMSPVIYSLEIDDVEMSTVKSKVKALIEETKN